MTTLVLAAHPDDEVLGCGGTIRKLTADGEDVFIAILGEGITSRSATREASDPDAVSSLDATAHEVASFLGAKKLVTYRLPDNRFDTIPLLDIVKIIEDLIDELEPDTVYTQHGGDLNVDHVQLFRATLTATRPVEGCPVQTVYAYEVASSSEWAFQQFSPSFQPTSYVDIAATLDDKIKAMAMYESEARPFPHPRSSESLRARAKFIGTCCGRHAAEAFQLVRDIQR